MTWTKGGHTFKFGGEYRRLQSDFQFLGSTEITYNSVTDFIDNRPNAVAVALDSPVFSPQQYYLIGYMQDSWRASDRLTFELGLRYDFFSVVKEKNGNAKPFFIEENNFGPTSTTSTTQTGTTLLRGCRPSTGSTIRPFSVQGLDCSTAQASSRIAFSRLRTPSSGGAWAQPTFRATGWPIRCRPRRT